MGGSGRASAFVGASEGAATAAMRQRRGEVTVGAEAAEATIAGSSGGGADGHGGDRRVAVAVTPGRSFLLLCSHLGNARCRLTPL